MNKEERALIIWELRERGVHPSWISFWLQVYPHDLLDLHNRGWTDWWVDGRWKNRKDE
jgi:hypothetical protein